MASLPMGHWEFGARAPSSLGNSVHFAAADSLTVKISKITKEMHVVNFHLSRKKHAKTHVNRLKQSWDPKEMKSRVDEERKKFIMCPLTSFPGDATARPYE